MAVMLRPSIMGAPTSEPLAATSAPIRLMMFAASRGCISPRFSPVMSTTWIVRARMRSLIRCSNVGLLS